ncbi:MAG: neutral zinc metallopeptidase [Patescibacteria group bacterium]
MALWDKLSSRGNVEDRRSFGPAAGGLGLTGLAIVAAFTLLTGGDVTSLLPTVLNELQSTQAPAQSYNAADFEGADSYEVFASTVLGSTDETWTSAFASSGRTYDAPTLVLFRGSTGSACGGATSDIGPHYCPADETIYLDETFFEELTTRFGAEGGDVAQAYVIAHEAGHHVQHELGTSDSVSRDGSNEASIKLELQADCYAGIWANSIRDLGVFEAGEITEAIDAAAAVGDDRIQAKSDRRINPETWTHGSSAERVRWFTIGYEQGSVDACDTFAS